MRGYPDTNPVWKMQYSESMSKGFLICVKYFITSVEVGEMRFDTV
jgi:hypothetical protein